MSNALENFRPWHEEEFAKLVTAYKTDSLHHALMLTGPKYIGKQFLANGYARFLLCDRNMEDGVNENCGQCKSCLLMKANTHPDIYRLDVPEGKKQIPVDAVRNISLNLNKKAQISKNKVCILAPAEALNENAANALLKILEEPPQNTFFIIVSHDSHRLLPTILSRCLKMKFSLPDKQEVEMWLTELFEGNDAIQNILLSANALPELAKSMLEGSFEANEVHDLLEKFLEKKNNSLSLAEQLSKEPLQNVIDIFTMLVQYRLKQSMLSELSEVEKWMAINGEVLKVRNHLHGNPNPRLFLENLFLDCERIL